MRPIKLTMTNVIVGEALTWAYPDGHALGHFLIPTYRLTVAGSDDLGKKAERHFEVFRFGIQGKDRGKGPEARVVGLADLQTHVIKSWLPHYTVHSARSVERGAWQVYDNFLIHDGPDDPHTEVYASIGCIEICNGPRGFDMFNDYLIALSGATAAGRADRLAQIGKARNMTITYHKATRPPLKKAP
ncbi:hypothetical protein [Acanthopleuribacter pedis]|uniref:Uncharacterized protein n=1 Tax=Acanthopleuribacter pedis TaxID=442870 RepID=A0A8J7QK88_9BACT|nr:hypothetical protein [Acanthopleuribacter pedis]MBO1322511.1 hypothetical protein [Acanthopleuribacter pedis]